MEDYFQLLGISAASNELNRRNLSRKCRSARVGMFHLTFFDVGWLTFAFSRRESWSIFGDSMRIPSRIVSSRYLSEDSHVVECEKSHVYRRFPLDSLSFPLPLVGFSASLFLALNVRTNRATVRYSLFVALSVPLSQTERIVAGLERANFPKSREFLWKNASSVWWILRFCRECKPKRWKSQTERGEAKAAGVSGAL